MKKVKYQWDGQLSPNKETLPKLVLAWDAYKWVYNHFLNLRSREDPELLDQVFPAAAYSRILTSLRHDVPLLAKTASHIQQAAIRKLSDHYVEVISGKRDYILPLDFYTDYSISVQGSSLSFGKGWVRFPKAGKIRCKQAREDDDCYKLVFHRPSENTYTVTFMTYLEVES